VSRLLARIQRKELEEQKRLAVEEALRAGSASAPTGARAAEGDPDRLRLIPAIGRGVGGAIPGDAATPEQSPGPVERALDVHQDRLELRHRRGLGPGFAL
jgi:hypothetical protein